MDQKRRNKVILAWVCFAAAILLLVASLTGFGFRTGVAIPIAMMLVIFGILFSAAVKRDSVS